jgi:predicted nucleic acid-binding Zn ribbon protein
MITENYTCPACGSEYEIQQRKTMLRDRDSINCEVCGREIRSWNGGVMFTSKITKRGAISNPTDCHNKQQV